MQSVVQSSLVGEGSQPGTLQLAAQVAAFAVALAGCSAIGPMLYGALFVPGYHWLIWICLLPCAWGLCSATPAAVAYPGAFLGGAVFHMLGLAWMRKCERPGLLGEWVNCGLTPMWLVATLAGAAAWTTACLVGRHTRRRTNWPMGIVLPLTWVTYEFVRQGAFALVGGDPLPWFLGHALVHYQRLMQIADIAGVATLAWLVACVNGSVFDAFTLRHQCGRPRASLVIFALVSLSFLMSAWFYGRWRLCQPLGAMGPAIGMTTRTFGPGADLPPASTAWAYTPEWGLRGVGDCPATGAPRVDLWVWPEMALETGVRTTRSEADDIFVDPECPGVRQLQQVAAEMETDILVGTFRAEEDRLGGKTVHYNSLVHVDSEAGFCSVYDKAHPVPFVEYVPPWLEYLGVSRFTSLRWPTLAEPNLRAGTGPAPILLHAQCEPCAVSVAATICYDICFPDLHRRYMRIGGKTPCAPELFVCASSELFDRTGIASEISFAHMRLRAVECRRPYYRITRGGLSGIVDSRGKVLVRFDDRADTPVRIIGQVRKDERNTLYCRYGDWLPATCLVITLAVCLRGLNGVSQSWGATALLSIMVCPAQMVGSSPIESWHTSVAMGVTKITQCHLVSRVREETTVSRQPDDNTKAVPW